MGSGLLLISVMAVPLPGPGGDAPGINSETGGQSGYFSASPLGPALDGPYRTGGDHLAGVAQGMWMALALSAEWGPADSGSTKGWAKTSSSLGLSCTVKVLCSGCPGVVVRLLG